MNRMLRRKTKKEKHRKAKKKAAEQNRTEIRRRRELASQAKELWPEIEAIWREWEASAAGGVKAPMQLHEFIINKGKIGELEPDEVIHYLDVATRFVEASSGGPIKPAVPMDAALALRGKVERMMGTNAITDPLRGLRDQSPPASGLVKGR